MRICNRACHHQALLVSIPPVPSWSNCQHGALTQENNSVFQTRNPQEKKDIEQETRGCCGGLGKKLKILIYVKLVMPTLNSWEKRQMRTGEIK